MGTVIASEHAASAPYGALHAVHGPARSSASAAAWTSRPDWTIIRSLFRFGLPTGVQGIAMNIAGVMLLRFIGSLEHSAAAQAAYAIGYTELFSLITWTSVGLMGAAATDRRAEPRRRTTRTRHAGRARRVADRTRVAAAVGLAFLAVPAALLGSSATTDPAVATIGDAAASVPRVSGFFITVALSYTGGLQGTGDTRSPLFISLASQIAVPIGMCALHPSIAPAPRRRHLARDRPRPLHPRVLTVLRFRQGRGGESRWRSRGATRRPLARMKFNARRFIHD